MTCRMILSKRTLFMRMAALMIFVVFFVPAGKPDVDHTLFEGLVESIAHCTDGLCLADFPNPGSRGMEQSRET